MSKHSDSFHYKPYHDIDKRTIKTRLLGQSLVQNVSEAQAVLRADLRKNAFHVVENAVLGLVGLGLEDGIRDIILALNERGTKELAETLLNCGHNRLRDEAESWAERNGYAITEGHTTPPVRWGAFDEPG